APEVLESEESSATVANLEESQTESSQTESPQTEAPLTEAAPGESQSEETKTEEPETASLIQKREITPTTESSVQEEQESELEEDLIVDDAQCDPDTKPLEVDKCFKLPCDETGSVEW